MTVARADGGSVRDSLREVVAAMPNLLKLVARLAADPRIPRRRRLVAMGGLAYAALPIDLIPDRIPVVGKADEVVFIVLALRMLMRAAGRELLEEHWDGSPQTLDAIDDLVDWASGLVPSSLRLAFDRLGT